MKIINPKVSIIIPVYNGSNYLKQAIDSALAQTYKNIEVIVINDGSNDNNATEKIAKSYGNKIKYFKKENGGVATALNLGIDKMTGEYFSWLSHDDMYYAKKIEIQIKQIMGMKRDTIVISDWTTVGDSGAAMKRNRVDDILEFVPKSFLAFDRKTWLNGCAMLIPLDMFERYGNFDESLKTTQDYDMFHRLVKEGVSFKIIHQPLLYSRYHTEQGSRSDINAHENSDIIHAKIINDLSHKDIEEYFKGDQRHYISVYDSFFSDGYKRTSAYFIGAVVGSLIKQNKINIAVDIISKKLIGDDVDKEKNDFDNFINKLKGRSDKKRIMFCSGHWLTGGMERVLSNLFQELNKRYDIFLLTPFDGRESYIALPGYVTHIKISNDLFYGHFDTVVLSYALMFDISVVTGFMNMFAKQLDFYKLCVGTGIKTIASNHEYYLYPYKNLHHYNVVEKRLDAFKYVDAVLWPTNFSAALCDIYTGNSYLLANPNTFKVQNNIINKNNQKIILCVGRFNDYIKRVDRILNCFALVLKEEPNAKLVLVGKYDKDIPIKPGDSVTINDLLKRLNINNGSITFTGEISNVKDYYAKASLILLTSNNEGFGMVLNEAACFGVPAVCNAIPGIEDLVKDGENGYITEQDDIRSMADRVCQILSDNKLREELGKNAKRFVEKFNAVEIGDKWVYLIDSLLEEKSKEGLRTRLNDQLSYTIIDYKVFSRVLAIELNTIFAATTSSYPINQVVNVSFLDGGKSYAKRLVASIKIEGSRRTVKKIVKKLYKKLLK